MSKKPELPIIARGDFSAELARLSPSPLSEDALSRLWIHYEELRRWNRRYSLVGPGSGPDVIERHYGESLAALELLEEADRTLVDIGTGAGFPGLILAAARPDLDVTLVESQQKKWSFLSLVCEKAALPCHCLNARVGTVLPGDFPLKIDVVATRAVRFSGAESAGLAMRLTDRGRFLVWEGAESPLGSTNLLLGREIPIEGSMNRRIAEYRPTREAS